MAGKDGRRWDRERFAYELAQELGVEASRVRGATGQEGLGQVRAGIQGTMEYGLRPGTEAAVAPDDEAAPSALAQGATSADGALKAGPMRPRRSPNRPSR
jgi:hypothetical protein